MKEKEEKKGMLNAHVLNLLKPFLEGISPSEEKNLQIFLYNGFPKLLTHEAFACCCEDVQWEIHNSPFMLLRLFLTPERIKLMGKKELFHIDYLVENFPHPEHIEDDPDIKNLEEIRQKIQEVDQKRGLDRNSFEYMLIDDECDTLGKFKHRKAALNALLGLYEMYLKSPETEDHILGRVKYYSHQISYLAEDFCDGKTILPAEDLNPFQLIVREIRLETQSKKKTVEVV